MTEASLRPVSPETPTARAAIFVLSVVIIALATSVVYLTPREVTAGTPSVLANLNAVLNAAAGGFLLLGYAFIRKKQVRAHRACMLAAVVVSTGFLVTYLLHHSQVGSVPFQGQGWVRAAYFSILIPHIVLAAGIVPLALFTLYRGLTGKIPGHRRIAKVTLPLWLFVSFSGVAVYWMLYHL